MTLHIGVGGANKAVAGVWVGVGGAWKYVPRLDVGVGGAWKLGFSGIALDATYDVGDVAAGVATAGFELNTDGNIYATTHLGTTAIGEWMVPGDNGASYEVVATLNSGTVDTGSFGTLGLGTSRSWTCVRSGVGTQTANISLAIRLVGTSVAIDSTVLTLSAESA